MGPHTLSRLLFYIGEDRVRDSGESKGTFKRLLQKALNVKPIYFEKINNSYFQHLSPDVIRISKEILHGNCSGLSLQNK